MIKASFSRTKLLLALGLSTAIALTGCSSTGSSLFGPQADPRLTAGSDAEFFSKSGFQACAAGAGVAALACLAASDNKATCMIVAGIAACGVAMGGNYYLDQRRSEFSNTNERLQAYTKDVQADTQRIVSRTETAYAVIQDDKRTLETLKKQIAAKEISVDSAQTELNAIDNNITLLGKELSNMQARADSYQEVAQREKEEGASQKSLADLNRSIGEMNTKIAALKSEVDTLYSQREAIKLG